MILRLRLDDMTLWSDEPVDGESRSVLLPDWSRVAAFADQELRFHGSAMEHGTTGRALPYRVGIGDPVLSSWRWIMPEGPQGLLDHGAASLLPDVSPLHFVPPSEYGTIVYRGAAYTVRQHFYIDQISGDDHHLGHHPAGAWATFWPLRWWFAQIDLLSPDPDWDFSGYHPTVFLARGSTWSVDTEWYDYLDSKTGAFPSTPPEIHGYLGSPRILHKGMSFASFSGTLHLPMPALPIPPATLAAAWDACRDAYTTGDPAADYGSIPAFLKIPSGISTVTVTAYGEGTDAPAITCCYTYGYDESLISGTQRWKIGTLSATIDHADWHLDQYAILFHENTEVLVSEISISGFFQGLVFWGPYSVFTIQNVHFSDISKWAIHVSLIPHLHYVEWAEPTDLPGSTAWAWYPIQLELCPRSFDILDCTFERIGQSTSGAAIALGLCVSDVEIRDNTFVMCVDGVMSDASGSGLSVHDNDFILCMEGIDEGGDGNAIDLKGVRPRTWPGGVEPTTVDDIPESAWTLIYNNNFIGCSGVTIVLQKGTSFVRVWNNRLSDNYQGIMVTTGTMSVLPAPYESEWFDGGSATIFSGDLHGRILSGDVDPDFYYSALVDAPETLIDSLFCAK